MNQLWLTPPALSLGPLIALLVLVGCGGGEPQVPPIIPPDSVDNVLLVTVDTLRADVVGWGEGPYRAATPTLDRLAAQSRIFANARSHNVLTLPAHANLLTGLYPYEHGIRANSGFVLPDSIPTAATILAGAGFATAAVVGAFPLDARFGLNRGFEVYDDRYPEGSHRGRFMLAERPGDEVVERGRTWWRSMSGRRKFLWLHLFEPHAPYEPPAPFATQYEERPYLGEVAAVDAFLEPLIEPFLDGDEEPTLIVFTSDHGESLGEHGELTHGLFAYEATLRVPLVLWAPGIQTGTSSEPVRLVDILPTILEAVGVEGPADLPGRSLALPPADDEEIVTYFESIGPTLDRDWAPLRGVVKAGWKFVSLPIPELYDLTQDSKEMTDLASDRRQQAASLARELPEESSWPPRRQAVTEEEAEALFSLGYLTGGGSPKRVFDQGDDPKALVHLDRQIHEAMELHRQGKRSQSIELVESVVRERPMGVAYTFLAQMLLQEERVAEAIEAMEHAVVKGAITPALIRQLGLSLIEVGRADDAVKLLERWAEGGDPDILNALGAALSGAGRQDAARSTLEQVLVRDPDNPVAFEQLALVELRNSNWTGAQDRASQALERNDELTLAWSYLGTALHNLGELEQARDAWQKSVALDPNNFDALYNLVLVASELEDWELMRRSLQRFVATAPPERYEADIERARMWLGQFDS